jgi:hypothetical protein
MAAMTQIPEFFTTEFEANWRHLAQQKNERCREYIQVDDVEGKEKSYNQMGEIDFQQVTLRAGPTRITDTPLAKRWVRPLPYDVASLFDEWDEKFLGQVKLPKSDTVTAHGYGYSRLVDRIILAAAVGTAYTGETGTTPTTLPGSQAIAVNFVESGSVANSGLTIGKLRQAQYILDTNEVDEEDTRTVFFSAKQRQDLLRTTEVTSSDYASVKALVEGKIDTFLGFKFKRVNKDFLPYNAGTDVRTIVITTRMGMMFTDAGKRSSMAIRYDLSEALQIRSVCAIGATRMEEDRVITIACDESP